MANTSRRILDKNGKQFIPMNVEGQGYNDNFITTPKLVTLGGIFIYLGATIISLSSNNATGSQWFWHILIWLIISSTATRYIIFEEKYYYKMYKLLQKHEITTPAIAWDIVSMKDTDDGCILSYTDAKVGVVVKIDRDTITGKDPDFRESHYDAVSNFYKTIVDYGYCFVQLDMMETSGKDPRLPELDKLTLDCNNTNIKRLVDLQIGHIKNIAQNSLFETTHILIYTKDVSKIDNIIPDVIEIMFKILDGAYVGYSILGRKEIVDIQKERFGVKYFDTTAASLSVYQRNGGGAAPFIISNIIWETGEEQEINSQLRGKLRIITSSVLDGHKDMPDSLKDLIYEEKKEQKYGVDFDKLGEWNNQGNRTTHNINNNPIINNTNRVNVNIHKNTQNQQNVNFNNNLNKLDTNKNKLNNIEIDFDDEDDEIIDI